MVGRVRQVRVSVQQQGVRKNYIGIVSDTPEEERAVLSAWSTHSRAILHAVARLAAALRRRPREAQRRPSAP
jgi:hypothetical protein